MRQPPKMLTASRPLSARESDELLDALRRWESEKQRGTILFPYGVTPVWEPLKPNRPNRYPSLLAHKVTR